MLFRNTLAQSSRLIIGQALSVILAPLLISRLGLTAFGIWAVTGAAANYVGLLDLGITRSLSRFIALYDARGDAAAVRRCVTVGFVTVAVVGVLALAAAVVLAPVVDDALGHPIGTSAMRVVLVSSAALLSLQLLSSACDALAIGLRRMVPPNVAGIFGVVCNFGASVGVLLASPHLTDYAVANALAAIPAVIASAGAMVYVGGRDLLGRPSWALAREIVTFSVKTQLSVVATLVNTQTDKVVVAVAVGVRAAAAYEIGARVALAARDMATLSVSAMIPTATAEIVRHGAEMIGRFYRDWSRRVIALSVAVFGLACVSSPYLLTAWLGQTPKDARGILVGLCLAFLVWMVTGVPSTVAIGAGHPGLPARNAVAAAVLNLALTAALAPLFGTVGVLVGTVVAMTVMALAFVVQFHRVFSIPAQAFRDAVVGPSTLGLAVAAPLGLLVGFVLPTPDGRGGAFGLLVLVGGAFTLAYWYGATVRDYLPEKLRLPGVRVRAAAPTPVPPA